MVKKSTSDNVSTQNISLSLAARNYKKKFLLHKILSLGFIKYDRSLKFIKKIKNKTYPK